MKYLAPSTVEKLLDEQENQNYLRSFYEESINEVGLSFKGKEVIRDIVAGLNDEGKKIIHLKFWEGYSVNEIAYRLGKRTSTVEKTLEQSLTLLRQALREKIEDMAREGFIKD